MKSRKHTPGYRVVMATNLVVLVIVAMACAFAASAHADIVATQHSGTEVCFPARLWSAWWEDDPCITTQRPQEDGSSTLYLGTVGADAAVCTIPNPFEERGRFTLRCHRVPNR